MSKNFGVYNSADAIDIEDNEDEVQNVVVEEYQNRRESSEIDLRRAMNMPRSIETKKTPLREDDFSFEKNNEGPQPFIK